MTTNTLAPRLSVVVEVDGAGPLEQLISAGGYTWKNWNINEENFPQTHLWEGPDTIEFFHYPEGISSLDDVREDMKKEGFRPIFLRELLAIGIHHPDLQKEFPICALSSRITILDVVKQTYVPELDMATYGRGLALCNVMFGRGPTYRFGAVSLP